ncbi:MAG: right-handed parallel beta-helix repeat-containing protein [Hyphomicrobiaceae bacterium]
MARRARAAPDWRAGRRLIIELGPGVHRLERPLRLGRDDSGTAAAPFVIRGAPDGSSVLSGSTRLRAAGRRPAALLARMTASARANVRFFALPAGLPRPDHIDRERFHAVPADPIPLEVFDRSGPLVPARWPNADWAAADGTTSETAGLPLRLRIPPARAVAWQGEPDLWVAGYWRWGWSFETQRVAQVDAGGRLTTATGARYGFVQGARYYVYHALAELDRPGEWYLDHRTGLLAVWPRPGADGPLEISVAASAFVIEGARHVRIERLTVERVRGDAIRIKDASDVVIANCLVHWTGGRGVVVESSLASGIKDSTVRQTGEGGIWLSGGDRRRLLPAGLFVTGTDIQHFDRLGRTEKPAVRLDGVGQIVTDNVVRDGWHVALRFQGNDHLIAYNSFARVVKDGTDTGAIYSGRDWAARGTRLLFNFLRDVKPRPGAEVKGIYLDDMASGTEVRGNLFLRVDQPVFIGGGRDNRISDNVFVASAPGVHIDGRGLTWAARSITSPQSELRRRLEAVPYRSEVWRRRYPDLPRLLEEEPAHAKGNVVSGNLFLAGQPLHLLAEVDARRQRIADLRSFTVQQLEQRLGSQDVRRLLEASSTQRVRAILAHLGADPTLDGLPFERWQALSAQVGATFACKPSERFAPDRKPCR